MKKIYTFPGGKLIFIIFVFSFLIMLFFGIILLPQIESIYLFIFCLIYFFLIRSSYNNDILNYLIVDLNGIKSKQYFYNWENVVFTIRIFYPKIGLSRSRGYQLFLFVSTENLLDQNIEQIIQNKMYIRINTKRLKYLLKKYNKKIFYENAVLNHHKIKFIIFEHNENLQEL